ncbi:MAG: diacylglycerol kinase family protein [Candidatus Omnitrophica bacterium]|jgi:diacylglycerol kinase (ATP)|nr:diacylglycerol kinase family protein [Candidatus Omnitrophota bacterium]
MPKNKIIANVFKTNSFMESLKISIKGLIYLFLYHRNMRIIFVCGLAALLFGYFLKLKGIELVALSITVALVFMAEIFNTAIEMMMNIVSGEHNVKIKLIKDIAAAVVVVTCVNSLAVAYILFWKKLF